MKIHRCSALAYGAVCATALLALASPASQAAPAPDRPMPDQLDLPTALGFALQNNFSIRQAQERIRQQEGVLVEVKAQTLPTVSSSSGYQYNAKEISSSYPASDRNWSLSLRATQVLYSGGGVKASVRSQSVLREAALLSLQSVIDDVLAATRTQFYTVLLSRDAIKVQEDNVTLLQRQLQDVRNRRKAGLVSPFEVLRAEVALANAQPTLIRASNDYRLAIEQLRQYLGVSTRREADLAHLPEILGTLEYRPLNFELRSLLNTAHEQRADLLRQRRIEAATEEAIRVQQANARPSLSLVGGYDWQKSPTSGGFSNPIDGWMIGLQSQWNIFDGRATAGKVAQARSQLEQARLSTAELLLGIDVDVRRALSSLQEATELAEASKKVVDMATESLRQANARFGAGTATQLDVLTSQVALTEARINQLQAFYSYNVAITQVRKTAGMGDESVSRAASP
jgi:outer membrane protein TolC